MRRQCGESRWIKSEIGYRSWGYYRQGGYYHHIYLLLTFLSTKLNINFFRSHWNLWSNCLWEISYENMSQQIIQTAVNPVLRWRNNSTITENVKINNIINLDPYLSLTVVPILWCFRNWKWAEILSGTYSKKSAPFWVQSIHCCPGYGQEFRFRLKIC